MLDTTINTGEEMASHHNSHVTDGSTPDEAMEMPPNVPSAIKLVGLLGLPVLIIGWVVYASLNFIFTDMQKGMGEIKSLQERSIVVQSDMLEVLKDIRRGK